MTAAKTELASMKKSSSELGLRVFEVARVELEGLIELKSGQQVRGLALLRLAAKMEAALSYNEPPSYPRPVLELLGRTLLDLRDFKGAESVYREALVREAGSGRPMWGLAKSLEGAGNKTEAQKARREFLTAWATADADLPEMSNR